MKTMKSKKNKKNKSQKAQQSFTERIAKAAGGFKERAKSMNSEEKAEQVQQPEQPETQQAQPEGGETEVDVKALQAELEKAKAQSDEYLDLAQRKQAEFANYRRRTEGIRAEAFDDGRREAISQLLPIVDNLERALAAAGEEDALKSGVEMVLRQTREALTKMGVEEIDVASSILYILYTTVSFYLNLCSYILYLTNTFHVFQFPIRYNKRNRQQEENHDQIFYIR